VPGESVTRAFPHSGLYAITAGDRPGRSLPDAVASAIRGGAVVIQYRDKTATEVDRERRAASLLGVCRAHGVPLIINDDLALTQRIAADGVHLGGDDGSVAEARRLLGSRTLIGASCYDSLTLALVAEQQGADYVAFGRFFPSRTKPGATLANPATLAEARRLLSVPLVAIGGITPQNGASLLQAGAGLLAVIDAVFGVDDPETAARAFAGLFDSVPDREASPG
jgi:thiamine-phosphate pyrophosphorylase